MFPTAGFGVEIAVPDENDELPRMNTGKLVRLLADHSAGPLDGSSD